MRNPPPIAYEKVLDDYLNAPAEDPRNAEAYKLSRKWLAADVRAYLEDTGQEMWERAFDARVDRSTGVLIRFRAAERGLLNQKTTP